MASAGAVLFLLLNQVLGNPMDDFWRELVRRVDLFLLVGVWLGYHLYVLINDGRLAHLALGKRHAAFPVLLVVDSDTPLAVELQEALKRQAPQLPLAIHRLDETPLAETASSASLVVMTAGLALDPPDELRGWLKQQNKGQECGW
jgi:hypothetical protein